MHHGAQSARDGQLRQTSARGVQGVPPAFKILVSPLPRFLPERDYPWATVQQPYLGIAGCLPLLETSAKDAN
jgi:hypothetical protein